MKYLIIIAITMLIACDDDSPNSSDENISEVKYTIEELENDPDWVEITDIDTVEVAVCIDPKLYENSLAIFSSQDFKDLYGKSLEQREEMEKYVDCNEDIFVNFNDRVLILAHKITGGQPIITRRIFKNNTKVIYLALIERTSGTEEASGLSEQITIPKFDNLTEIIFQIEDSSVK